MPLSLADRILSYRNVGGRHGGLRRAPNEEGSRDPEPAGKEPACTPDPGEAARMRCLFGDVARDGSGLAEAVGNLKKALVGSAVEQTIGAAGVRAAAEQEEVGRRLQGGAPEALPPGIEDLR